MMPEASLVFFDEIFNANSAILNSLLMALNEKIFRRGKETRRLPALMFVGASNMLPEDEALQALLDRFLIRVKCENVDPELLQEVLLAGWRMEAGGQEQQPLISSEAIVLLQKACREIDLSTIRPAYIDIVHSLRNTGIKVSDRRAVKLQNIIAASALVCGRPTAILSDLWVLKYIWDTEEQIEILTGIIDAVIEKDKAGPAHPQALYNKVPDPEEVMKEVSFLFSRWAQTDLSFEEQNVIKDKLRYVQTRCSWIKNPEQKQFVQQEIDGLWQKILQTI
jgi:MoxR-like ATPase